LRSSKGNNKLSPTITEFGTRNKKISKRGVSAMKFRTSTANFISPSRSPPWEKKETFKKIKSDAEKLAMTKSFEAHKSKDFRSIKYLMCNSNKISIKKNYKAKIGSRSPKNHNEKEKSTESHYAAMIRKIQKEATKISFFKDLSISKFDEVTKNKNLRNLLPI